MPGFNGTGPDGAGSMTGRGMGNCSGNGTGAGRGRGMGRGAGIRRGAGSGGVRRLEDVSVVSDGDAGKNDMLGAVMQRLDAMQADLESVKKRLDTDVNEKGIEGDVSARNDSSRTHVFPNEVLYGDKYG